MFLIKVLVALIKSLFYGIILFSALFLGVILLEYLGLLPSTTLTVRMLAQPQATQTHTVCTAVIPIA